jgi:AcrR family transcriptional regulator
MPSAGASKTRGRPDSQRVRSQILDAFSAKAKRIGIRSVMMAELASELRMSASTLYKHFPSKEALTLACVERWALELAASEAAESSPGQRLDGFEQFMHWADAWADANAVLSPAFARDLRSDYPEAWQRYAEVIRERQRRGVELLRPVLKPDLDERVAFAVLELIMNAVLRPEFADRLRISRHEAIRGAISIWAAGAVDRRGQLRALRESRRERNG